MPRNCLPSQRIVSSNTKTHSTNTYKWQLGLLYKMYLSSGEIAVTDGELNDNGHNLMVDWPKGKAQTSNHVKYVCL